MAAPKKKRAREVQLGFEAISIEGGLLSPEWLSRIAQLNAGAQSESDYRIPKGLNLRDEIGRYWRIAQAHWHEFSAGLSANADSRALAVRFVEALLGDAFGYASLVRTEPVIIAERGYPIGATALNGRLPVVVASAGCGLDTLATVFGDGGRRRSAFGLAQEYLNAQDGALWGIASDGLAIRIVRDNASLTRPAWIEADLQRVFTEERYADFAALWLLMHETRFGRADQPVTECALEVWRDAGREEGTRAREHLRRGVEDALLSLGQGFLSHPENQQLRADFRSGILSTKDYFNQLLRLVYRLIFLLTVEERGLLHASDASEEAKALYASGYGMRRLRDRSVKRSAHDRFSDIWEGTKVVLRGVASGEPRLGLPALAGIFAHGQCPNIDASKLENRALLLAVFRLAWLREQDSLVRVNWRDMGPEELGSVYESLLELVPQITTDGRQFAFATGSNTKGNARKTTGSYYTPDSLVQVLLDSALEPVIAETTSKHPEKPVEALLCLTIVDPACGSGHFLLAAARRLASHVARTRANGTPSAAEYRHALRQVVGRCIFGVDLNPMAVELCKVSLWMEAVEPGLPLTFLNSHIQHGNALLGTTPELMAEGIPDVAWEPIEGDDKKIASLLKKRSNSEAGGQRTLTFTADPSADENRVIGVAVTELEAASDADVAALSNKENKWENILESNAYRHQKLVHDAWCAAFVWPKQAAEHSDAAPTNELWRQIRDKTGKLPAVTATTINEIAEQYRFFHWRLQFPHVFAKGGFDVVLGNPPWERLKLDTEEWMRAAGLDISRATNAALRDKVLSDALAADLMLRQEWNQDRRRTAVIDQLLRAVGRYPHSAVGDLNSYAMFAELGVSLLQSFGRGAWILPLGIVTDKTYAGLCADLLQSGRLESVCGFVNERQLFADVLHNFKFVALTVGPKRPGKAAAFAFGMLETTDLRRVFRERGYQLGADDVAALNPDTRTCPVFVDGRMARVLISLHRAMRPIAQSGWAVKPRAMLHMGSASKHFVTTPNDQAATQVYESKMVNRYNHRFATFASLMPGERLHMLPRSGPEQLMDPNCESVSGYYCSSSVIKDLGGPSVDWFLVFRRIANPALSRTAAFCVIPKSGVGDSLSIVIPENDVTSKQWAEDAALLCWLGNSVVFDAILKQKMGGNNFSEYVWQQMPIPCRELMNDAWAWCGGQLLRSFVATRVCELSVTSHRISSFARDLGMGAIAFRWDEVRRSIMESELNAAAALVYGLSREDFEVLFDAFPVLKAREMEETGDFVTRSMALGAYDRMAAAALTGKPYESFLDPPAAHPDVAHAPRTGVVVPFPVRAPTQRELPQWGEAIVKDAASRAQVSLDPNAWSTKWTGDALGMAALAAVLRNIVRPTARAEVERAVVLTVLPRLMRPMLKGDCGKQWRNAIGSNSLAVDSIGSFGIPWNEVLRRAIQQGVLIEDGAGNWSAGPDVGDAPSAALDARAIVVLSWLATAPAQIDEVSTQVVALRAA